MRERIVRAVAGILVLVSVVLSFALSMQWIYLAGFVGFNLLQSSFTRFCPLEFILKKIGK